MELGQIVIVNHNTKKTDWTDNTVRFWYNKNISYEIIVADNSIDPSQVLDMKDDRVKILKNLENKGFGNACNIGTKVAIGKYILYLNSDTIMKSHTLELSVKYMEEHIEVGCLGIKTFLADGTFWPRLQERFSNSF